MPEEDLLRQAADAAGIEADQLRQAGAIDDVDIDAVSCRSNIFLGADIEDVRADQGFPAVAAEHTAIVGRENGSVGIDDRGGPDRVFDGAVDIDIRPAARVGDLNQRRRHLALDVERQGHCLRRVQPGKRLLVGDDIDVVDDDVLVGLVADRNALQRVAERPSAAGTDHRVGIEDDVARAGIDDVVDDDVGALDRIALSFAAATTAGAIVDGHLDRDVDLPVSTDDELFDNQFWRAAGENEDIRIEVDLLRAVVGAAAIGAAGGKRTLAVVGVIRLRDRAVDGGGIERQVFARCRGLLRIIRMAENTIRIVARAGGHQGSGRAGYLRCHVGIVVRIGIDEAEKACGMGIGLGMRLDVVVAGDEIDALPAGQFGVGIDMHFRLRPGRYGAFGLAFAIEAGAAAVAAGEDVEAPDFRAGNGAFGIQDRPVAEGCNRVGLIRIGVRIRNTDIDMRDGIAISAEADA
ncbi:hypothetical protein D9M72_413750 [compost metagenome]